MENIKEVTNNTYAYNLKGEAKHISEVEKGKKGYYCMGEDCNAEMIAVKGNIKSHHFRHVAKDVNIVRKCVYSDETYRHKLAKEILQRIKQIKVPKLEKLPPFGTAGNPRKIKDSWIIKAETVKNERQFYENESGDIQYGQKIDFEKEKGKFLLIQPDVTFFDDSDNPILLIEIVATHKISAEKLTKIKKLGIDTIQITIPKGSPEEIEYCFYKTSNTKWVYNHEKETTDYLLLPERNHQGILPIDKFERNLLRTEASFSCRSTAIKNLIRGIRKCLESEQYIRVKQSIGGELRRVENNTERNRERLRGLQEKYEREVRNSYNIEARKFREEEKQFEDRNRRIQERIAELGREHYERRRELKEAYDNNQPECKGEIDRIEKNLRELGTTSASFEEQEEEIRREEEQIECDFKEQEEEIRKEERWLLQNFREEENRIDENSRNEENELNELEKRRTTLSKQYDELEKKLRKEYKERGRRVRDEYEENEARIRDETEKRRRQAVDAVKNRFTEGVQPFHKRIREAMEGGRILLSISKGQSNLNKLREIKEFLDSKAYKNWV